MDLQLQILATGMSNAVGLYPAAVEAAVRAGISRVSEGSFCDLHDDLVSLACLPSASLPAFVPALEQLAGLGARTQRMLKLGAIALAGLATGAQLSKPPLLLAVPRTATLPGAFLEMLALQAGVDLDLGSSRVVPGGRATSLALLVEAQRMLLAGEQAAVIIGGLDCQVDLRTLATLSLDDRLTTERQSDGFAPGEGAAFVLVARAGGAEGGIGCQIETLGLGREPGIRGSEAPYRGDGLAEAFTEATTSLPAPASVVYTSFNGERYWTRELGVALMRNHGATREDVRLEHPAQAFGDLGAATGVSLLALAGEVARRRRIRGVGVVYASSEDGERAVVTIREEQGR